jgi:hypothetical protein
MERSKRKEREFNMRRAEILKKSEEVFATKGFHNFTIAGIAGTSFSPSVDFISSLKAKRIFIQRSSPRHACQSG